MTDIDEGGHSPLLEHIDSRLIELAHLYVQQSNDISSFCNNLSDFMVNSESEARVKELQSDYDEALLSIATLCDQVTTLISNQKSSKQVTFANSPVDDDDIMINATSEENTLVAQLLKKKLFREKQTVMNLEKLHILAANRVDELTTGTHLLKNELRRLEAHSSQLMKQISTERIERELEKEKDANMLQLITDEKGKLEERLELLEVQSLVATETKEENMQLQRQFQEIKGIVELQQDEIKLLQLELKSRTDNQELQMHDFAFAVSNILRVYSENGLSFTDNVK